jgi:hypothetical protein
MDGSLGTATRICKTVLEDPIMLADASKHQTERAGFVMENWLGEVVMFS